MVSSVLGGIFGYFIGKFFYGYIGGPLVDFYGMTAEVDRLGQLFKAHVFLTIFIASLTPVPYKVFTLSAGLFSVNLFAFILASIIGRSMRFFAVAYVSNRYGVKAKNIVMGNQRVATWVTYGLLAALILYIVLKSKGIL
jgi:membrane protein YqaA with SNARE-associated domain